MNYKRSDGICLVCSKANTNSIANLSAFECDGEHFGLCGKICIFIMFHAFLIFFFIIDTLHINMIIKTDGSNVLSFKFRTKDTGSCKSEKSD